MRKIIYKYILFIILSLAVCQSNHPYPPLHLITIPTSGVLPYGNYSLEGLLIDNGGMVPKLSIGISCLLYTSPSPRDGLLSRMPSSA